VRVVEFLPPVVDFATVGLEEELVLMMVLREMVL
jgi:hypothetical protein